MHVSGGSLNGVWVENLHLNLLYMYVVDMFQVFYTYTISEWK